MIYVRPQELNKVLACQSLPSLPTVGVQVLTLTRDPDVSMDQIAKVIETDLALSAKVLKTVNSSVYGLRAVHHHPAPLDYLGLSAVKSIVLGFSLVESTRPPASRALTSTTTGDARSSARIAASSRRSAAVIPEEAFAAAAVPGSRRARIAHRGGSPIHRRNRRCARDHAAHPPSKPPRGSASRMPSAVLHWQPNGASRSLRPDHQHHHASTARTSTVDLVRVVGLGTHRRRPRIQHSDQLPELLAKSRLWFNLTSADMAILLGQIGKASAELAKLFGKPVGIIPDSAELMHRGNEELVNQQIAAAREAENLREKGKP